MTKQEKIHQVRKLNFTGEISVKYIFTTISCLFLFSNLLLGAEVTNKKIYIAIESGAALGVIPAYLLRDIEQKTGAKIVDMADGLAGISTGAIISSLIANGNYTADQARQFYYDYSGKIFSAALWGGLSNLVAQTGLWEEVNAAAEFENVIAQKFANAKLCETKTYLMVLSSVDNEIVIFDSELAKNSSAHNTTQAMVVRATASLPNIYSKAHVKFDDDKSWECVDAASLGINDPTPYLYKKLYEEKYDGEIIIYSLGTGAQDVSKSTRALMDNNNNNSNSNIKIIRLQPDLSKVRGLEYYISPILFNANADHSRLKDLEACAQELTNTEEYAQMLEDFKRVSGGLGEVR